MVALDVLLPSRPVAYDETLAERIRELLAPEPGLSEQKMFGGLAFLVFGNMAVAASGQGGLLVRVDPADADELMASGEAAPMRMGGRDMNGWLHVGADAVKAERELARWVAIGAARAGALPPKTARRR